MVGGPDPPSEVPQRAVVVEWPGRDPPLRTDAGLDEGAGPRMSVTARLDSFQRRHPAAAFPLAVVYKFFEDTGAYLAAIITYYAFLALFPLLLLGTTILGLVLRDNVELQQTVLTSAVGQIPVIGQQLITDPQRIGGGVTGLVVGSIVALYGGLGFGMALQNAVNSVWAVPRNSRPNPFKARGRALLLLAVVSLGVLTAVASTAVASGLGGQGSLVKWASAAASVVLNAAVLTLGFRIATATKIARADVLPGAVLAALVWQVLQVFGASYVKRVVNSASVSSGTFAVVLGLIAFIHLASLTLVLCAELNVVRARRLYPRALLTPLTDAVELTEGDQRVYRDLARAQRHKGFEEIDVTFDKR